MTNGPRSNSSPGVEAITGALVQTVADLLPLLRTAILDSFSQSQEDGVVMQLEPVTPGLPKTYLVELTLSESALRVFLAASEVPQITVDDITRGQQSPLFQGVDIIGAIAELRQAGLLVRNMSAGEVIYTPTACAVGVLTDMLEDGVAPELDSYVGLLR